MNTKSKGATSGIFLILGIVLLVVIVIVFVVIKINAVKTADKAKQTSSQNSNQPPKPVYQLQLGDVNFTFESAQDMGQVLKSDNQFAKPLTTTEKFIKVIVGAQNKGKINIPQNSWALGNIVDSDGRNFIPVNDSGLTYNTYGVAGCGSLLKPEFEPTPCIKYYEVSKESTGLKVEINVTSGSSIRKKQEGFLDLIVQ